MTKTELKRLGYEFIDALVEFIDGGQPKRKPKKVTLNKKMEEKVMEQWNSMSPPFSKIQTMSPDRKRHLRNRLSDEWWKDNWSMAMEMLNALPNNSWYKGNNDKKWVATFDWFLRPQSVVKLIEEARRASKRTITIEYQGDREI